MARSKKQDEVYRNPRDFEGRKDQEILTQVMGDFETHEKALKPRFEKFQKLYQLYRSYMAEEDKREHGSNLFIPYTFSIVETAVPKIVMAMFDSRPFLAYKPVSSDDVQKAKNMTALVDYQIHNKMRAIPIYVDIVKSACIYGTAISKQTWKLQTKKFVQRKEKPVLNPETGQPVMNLETGQPETYTAEVLMEGIKYDAPYIQNIPLEDFIYDTYATDIDSARFCAHRYWLPLYELKEGESKGIYRNIKMLQSGSSSQIKSGVDTREESIGINNKPTREDIEIIEYWTDDWKVVIANRAVVIQCVENPYYHRRKPFSKWVDVSVPNEFYGIGEVEMTENLQYELNTTRSQRIDNVTFVLNRMWKILRTANIDTTQLTSRANGFIEVDSPDDVTELEFKDVTQSAYQEESVIKADMNDVTGIHNQDRGAPSGRRETATTSTIMAQGSTERFKLKVTLIEDGGFSDSGMQIAELNKQYVDVDTEVRIIGDNGMEEPTIMSPEDIDVDLDLVAVGSAVEPVVNKEIRQNQLIQLLNVAQNSPYVNMPVLLKEIFEAFDMKDVNKFIITPQQQGGVLPNPTEPGNPVISPEMMQQLGGMLNGQ